MLKEQSCFFVVQGYFFVVQSAECRVQICRPDGINLELLNPFITDFCLDLSQMQAKRLALKSSHHLCRIYPRFLVIYLRFTIRFLNQ